MGHRCCNKQKIKRGLWSPEEDEKLIRFITNHGHGCWSSVPKLAGLDRCGKSCRLRWMNYLRPDLKRGSFTPEEEQIIIDVHRILGNKWAQIAKLLPGRTDNEVKNFWHSCIRKKLISQGLDPNTHNLISSDSFQQNLNKATCTPSLIHQSSSTVITVSMPNISNASSTVMNIPTGIKTPEFHFSNAQPQLPQELAMLTYEHQNTITMVWNENDHNFNNILSFPENGLSNENCIFCSSSSSSANVNKSEYGSLMHENSMWGSNSFESIEAPAVLDRDKEQQKWKPYPMWHTDEINNAEGIGDVRMTDVSLDSSGLGIQHEESMLMSEAICHDLSSLDDLSWNY